MVPRARRRLALPLPRGAESLTQTQEAFLRANKVYETLCASPKKLNSQPQRLALAKDHMPGRGQHVVRVDSEVAS